MICIRCGEDSKYPERTGKKCKKCGGAFAFEPRTGDVFTDMHLKKAIDAVSAEGAVAFHADHVHHRLRRGRPHRAKRAWVPLLVIAAAFAVSVAADLGPVLGVAIGLPTFIVWVTMGARRPYFTAEQFEAAWRRYLAVHGTPRRLIQRLPQPAAPERRLAELEPDVADYSFDRAVICDRARTADVFLANNFHFENNCAVLTEDGYPLQAFNTVRTMLARNPRLVVVAVHDASVEGCALAHRLRKDPAWFRGGPQVHDLGLTPRQARAYRSSWLPAKGTARLPARVELSDKDREWLERWTLELAVIPPEQLLKRVFRAFQAAEGATGSDGDLTVMATTSDGASDSFG
jgi:hypothetical protein